MKTIKAIQLFKKIESINKNLKSINCLPKTVYVNCHGITGICEDFQSFKELINKSLEIGAKYNDLKDVAIKILSDIDNLKLVIDYMGIFEHESVMLNIEIK